MPDLASTITDIHNFLWPRGVGEGKPNKNNNDETGSPLSHRKRTGQGQPGPLWRGRGGARGGRVRGEGTQKSPLPPAMTMPAPPSPPPTAGAMRDAPRHASARHHTQLRRGDRGHPGRAARSDRRAKQWTDLPSGTHTAPPARGTDGGHRRCCSLSRLLSSQRVVGGDSDGGAAGDEPQAGKNKQLSPRPSSSIFSRPGGKCC